MSDSAVTLGQLAGHLDMLEVACRRCERHGRLSLARLIAQHGPDMRLPTLRHVLAADCPRQRATSLSDRCGVYYPQLPRLRLP